MIVVMYPSPFSTKEFTPKPKCNCNCSKQVGLASGTRSLDGGGGFAKKEEINYEWAQVKIFHLPKPGIRDKYVIFKCCSIIRHNWPNLRIFVLKYFLIVFFSPFLLFSKNEENQVISLSIKTPARVIIHMKYKIRFYSIFFGGR